MPDAAPMTTPLPDDADPTAVVPLVLRAVEALERKDYAAAVGLILMIATFAATRVPMLRALVPKEYTATALLGIAALGGFGAALASGVPPMRAALTFILCSATAIAFWEGVAKHVVRILSKKRAFGSWMPPS